MGLGFKVCKKLYKKELKLNGIVKFYNSAIDEIICDILGFWILIYLN